jgi:uncharacterized protein YbbK (DUF523 family)
MNETEFREPVLVSACLLGIDCRYDGGNSHRKEVVEVLSGKTPIPFCPELFAGLGVPREMCEITSGDGEDVLNNKSSILSSSGREVTQSVINGSLAGLKICILAGVKRAILKEKSPSCGVKTILNGGKPKNGSGVFAALLKRNNIEVISSDEI